ncbi:MAG TPA: DUF6262 family protein, partial [Ktedonobacteraceae bacterium]
MATDMIEQGVDIYTVKEFLGHTSLAMTERYVKVYLSSLKAKSEQKRQAAFAAIRELQQEKYPVTRSAAARQAGVSVIFLRSHPDLLQAIEEAEQRHRLAPSERTADTAKDQVIAALRRRLDEMKLQLAAKDQELRGKQRELDRLYGK